MNRIPRILTVEGSAPCERVGGLKELHRIPRTLPPPVLGPGDPDVLQDEDLAPILDETTNGYIYDTLRNGGSFLN